MKLKIKRKILFYVLGAMVLLYGSSLVYFSKKLYTIETQRSLKNLKTISCEHLNYGKNTLSSFMSSACMLASSLEEVGLLPEEERRDFVVKKMQQIMVKNPQYLSVWGIWEPYTIDNLDSLMIGKPTSTYLGNFTPGLFRIDNEIQMEKNDQVTELFVGDYFTIPKACLCPVVMEPYYYSYTHKKEDEILQTNMIVPIMPNGNFVGVVGIDVSLDYLHKKFGKEKPLSTGEVYLVSDEGEFVSCPDSSFIGKKIDDFFPKLEKKYALKEKIKNGENFQFSAFNPHLKQNCFFVFEKMSIGNSKNNWSFCVSVPNKTIYKGANQIFILVIFVGLGMFLLLFIIVSKYANYMSKAFHKITTPLSKLEKGEVNDREQINYRSNDEIKTLANAIIKLYKSLNSAVLFAKEIGKGNLHAEYNYLSKNDELGNSLVNMQNSLKEAEKEAEKKKIIEQNRNWVTRGLAKFGEIIRKNNDNMELFAQHVINEFATYMKIAQAAIFITEENEGNEQYVMKAAIAYGKPVIFEKFTEKGDELQGRAADLKKILYLKNLPQDYVQITPGKKDAKRPNHLIICPLIFNNITYGLLEIIDYNPFPAHQIEFVEKLSENIASVISSVKTNVQTAELLKKSDEQGDILSQHEEEMRQNLEELTATQEESSKKELILNEKIKAFKQSLMTAELDINGRVLFMTPNMLSHYGFTMESIKEKYFEGFIAHTQEDREKFNDFWGILLKNGENQRNQIIRKQDTELITQEIYQVINKDSIQAKVLLIAIDVSKEKRLKEELKKEIKSKK